MNPEITTRQLIDWKLLYAYLKEKNAQNKIFSSSFFNHLSPDENGAASYGLSRHIYKLNPHLFASAMSRYKDDREAFGLSRNPPDNTTLASSDIPIVSLLACVRYCLIEEAQVKGESTPQKLFRKYSVDL